MRYKRWAIGFFCWWCCLAAAAQAQSWQEYEGFNEMSLEEQRRLVMQGLEQLRSNYQGLYLRGQVEAETSSTLLPDPFAKPALRKERAIKHDSIHRVNFVMESDRIKVEGGALRREDGRVKRDKRVYSLDDGVELSLFNRDGKPVKLVRRCHDIEIQNDFELRVLLWATRPELSKYASLMNRFRGMDELKELVRVSNEFELKERRDGPDEIFMTWVYGENSEMREVVVFELGEQFRWTGLGSAKQIGDARHHSSWRIQYGTSLGLEVPEVWTDVYWKERVDPETGHAEIVESSRILRRMTLKKLQVTEKPTDSDFEIDVPEGTPVVDHCVADPH